MTSFEIKDRIHIKNLKLQTILGPDRWDQLNPQRCQVCVDIGTDFAMSSAMDDLKFSLNYATISKDVAQLVSNRKNWLTVGNLTRSIYSFLKNDSDYKSGVLDLTVSLQCQDVHLRTTDISCVIRDDLFDLWRIHNLELFCVLGVFTFERLQKQKISLDMDILWPRGSDNHKLLRSLIDKTAVYLENSNFKTVEALVESITQLVSQQINIPEENFSVQVKVTKLSAITDTDGVGVSCKRSGIEINCEDLVTTNESTTNDLTFNLPIENGSGTIFNGQWNKAYLAFGSNIGDRLNFITTAFSLLQANPKVRLVNSSSLFESEPMYFKDQQPFMNGCVEIETTLDPQALLAFCKKIEYEEIKRVKHFDNGPRSIDLDIIMYSNSDGEHVLVNDQNLVIPHPRMLERTFVLEPLCELIAPEMLHPITAEPITHYLSQIYEMDNDENNLWKLIPLPSLQNESHRFLKFKTVTKFDPVHTSVTHRRTVSPTYVMGIFNTTPDSFSDGGVFYQNSKEQILSNVKQMCADALELHDQVIIDIGGCSTRPNSAQPSLDEEIERTIEVIKAIRNCPDLNQEKVLISIDTYRSTVAEKAIETGADIINDISGASFDPRILDVVAANPYVAYVMSHIRGDINTMSKMTHYDTPKEFTTEGTDYIFNEICDTKATHFVRTIGREMSQTYQTALRKGVRRWQIIMDPGLGFAKKGTQNLDLIRQVPLLKNYSFVNSNTGGYTNLRNIPVLIGPSRKKFIGAITKEKVAADRDFATGSLVTACVGFDCDILRVHNIKNCAKSIKIADALYKDV
ncbi:trifunctional dihydropteroate synthetase/dihydrohydroxymethylpterin pyrophosphokinase/dihydroneopterin aldolase FOL1 KNAG_0F00590 [Huiozyma naganishii CBS 8797]|uniref:Folic acid synthesis protein fol1 n=1 Tax=Huiozyma naganishii (strain ATCC MYA-139 / BCRC 22969 / CBS 8797 / KCTC 17520 / NBRC 10181 / NCYC 3082 / Yp74L-3) TaxID=1071383 RepID=J7RMF1_HUIN7|nr:hypothetical protein KNAG_0F00590 [Kazachstania naganishii CBS 8797]CCK70728.1 hypothetical protein KNAG_0F00590 [Kazachstania naganishii CBS 8797]